MQFIYVVKRADLQDLLPETGIRLTSPEEIAPRLNRGFFIERSHAERDPEFKQIIPYCVLLRGPDVFVFRRLEGGGEARLHHLRSIGVGGHIEPTEEGAAWERILKAARREIEEEVEISPPCDASLQYRCILNDESNSVGHVHTGIVFVMEVPETVQIRVRETDVLEGGFQSMESLRRQSFDDFETWSRILLESDFLPYEKFHHEA